MTRLFYSISLLFLLICNITYSQERHIINDFAIVGSVFFRDTKLFGQGGIALERWNSEKETDRLKSYSSVAVNGFIGMTGLASGASLELTRSIPGLCITKKSTNSREKSYYFETLGIKAQYAAKSGINTVAIIPTASFYANFEEGAARHFLSLALVYGYEVYTINDIGWNPHYLEVKLLIVPSLFANSYGNKKIKI